ncbi:hypothetical protein E4U55_001487 [Claviceps digitariae]|nr:hypothetical protein E4U55_001487 [Claviceps digitariae]
MINSSPKREMDAAAVREAALPASSSSAPASISTTSIQAPSTSNCTSAAGTKRPAPSLLPAFEPLSSSPGLPRPVKRQNTGQAHLKYPTPVPTSSTGILSSSPPRPHSQSHHGLARSALGRAPLSSVPAVELPENGHLVAMGRSSNSSHFQLSANRLVSRVHIQARYIPAPSPLESNKIEVMCNGWNGLKLHCQGRTWELFKGDSFTSETEGTDLIVDVLDARVMIQWPKRSAATVESLANLSDSSWDDSPPRSQLRGNSLLQSSPLRRNTRITSPESPTPIGGSLASSQRLQALLPSVADAQDDGIQIYEDEPELPEPRRNNNDNNNTVDVGASMVTNATASFSSESSDIDDENEHHPNEENDPVVHSFGPFGANIAGRLASVSTKSPRRRPKPLGRPRQQPHHTSSNETLTTADLSSIPSSPIKEIKETVADSKPLASFPVADIKGPDEHVPSSRSSSPSSPCRPSAVPASTTTTPPPEEKDTPTPSIEVAPAVMNHVINQLAFSRLASTPLSTIMQNLPNEHKAGLNKDVLRITIEAAPCIGIIPRQGKDAAGKALESEYYYQPDQDRDLQRRTVVDAMRKPSLRNCRKQHKQYYWKRPKTP